MKRLDIFTYEKLMKTLQEHKYDWTFEQFREYRKELEVTRETRIPLSMLEGMLEWRYAEYNPWDYGLEGKYSEVAERVQLAIEQGKSLLWNDFRAHKSGTRDLSYGRKAVEKKTGAGDWLVSRRARTPESIVKEYSRKQSLIHWQVDDLDIDITCKWCELLEYLSHYTRKAGGPELGAAYFFKSYCKHQGDEDGDRWILEIQTYRNSEKKLTYIRNCPFNKK